MEGIWRWRSCSVGHRWIVKNVDVLVGNEEDLQGLGNQGRKLRQVKLDRSAFFGMIDRVVRGIPRSRSLPRPCAKCTPRTGIAGARWPGLMGKPTNLQLVSLMWLIVLAAVTDLRRGSSMRSFQENPQRKQSSWAGLMARS